MSSVFLSSSQFPIFCTTTTAVSATKTHRFACQASPRMSMNQTTPPDQQSPNPKTILSTLTNLLWGQSLPPGLLISTVRTTWNSTWQLMMSQLAPSDSSGRTLIVRALEGPGRCGPYLNCWTGSRWIMGIQR
ncbi:GLUTATHIONYL-HYDROQUINONE REDUCTASE [Salix koriyanagi]|uniref:GLUTATHIONYL-HYDROQUINONE REDUCTASE n=1 Tax=Salix koriyanagi TaxID=2511006 RepID=A0A9Q0Z7E1_9ROSI|nr:GLUTATHIONYL-HYDROQUINONE REDUCTASE [Salix koriyanagi]